jgi:membrane protease YdiL (CAAX protease family)
MNKKILSYFPPIILIGVCYIFVFLLNKIMREWAFIPGVLLYWILSFIFVYKITGILSIKAWFNKPSGRIGWLILAIIVGFTTLPILLRNLSIITSTLMILSIIFAIINSFFEEIYWRGFVIDFTFSSRIMSTIYSTILFVLSHLIWGIYSLGVRNIYTLGTLAIISPIWCLIRVKTKSLWWCILSHFLIDLLNLGVFIMLNKYIPEYGQLY